jgi:hypothetical protein
MFNLRSIFENFFLFSRTRISDDNLKKFVEVHIARLTANNTGGDFTTILNDMVAAYTAYFGNITDKDLALAVQQSLTLAADNLIANFKKTVSQKEGTIKSAYGKGSPTYQEFFPHGLTEYSNATKANVETLMSRMVASSTAHVADLTPAFVTLFTNIKSNYITARTLQLAKIADVGIQTTEKHETRATVEIQLCRNIHYIGFFYPGDGDRCMDFFDQSIIRANVDADSDGLGRVAGLITDTNGTPINDVVVDYPEEDRPSRKSKDGGKYKAVNVNTGPRKVRFTHPLHQVKEVTIMINDEGDTPLDVQLDPLP